MHVFVLAAIAITIGASSYFLLNDTVNEFEKRLLSEHADRVAPFVQVRGGRWQISLPSDITQIFSRGFGGYVLAITNDAGRVVYSSLPDRSALIRPPLGTEQATFLQRRHGRSVYYVAAVPIRRSGQTGWIEVGQDLADPEVIVDDVAARFLTRLVWPFVLLFSFFIALDVLIVRRLSAPILAASSVALTIGPANLSTRLPTRNLPNEVLPLADAVNAALDRLERALEIQREFTADAAHELRTPLTILRARVDTETGGAVRAELRADIDAMTHIIDQLLELAELEALPDARLAPVDLNTLCAEVAAGVTPMAAASGKQIVVQASKSANIVTGNALMLSRAVRNIVENAVRLSPAGGQVVLACQAPHRVDVMDNGPGLSPAEKDHVFRRFWRKDRQSADHAGLGLAIVARIVRLHQGEIKIEDRPGGGTIFSILIHHSSK